MNRRRLLLGGAATLTAAVAAGVGVIQLAEAGVIPGKSAIDRGLGYCDVPSPPPGHAAGPVVRASFASTARGRDVDYALAYPPGHGPGSPLPVCLLLHGFGADAAGALAAGAYPGHLADAVAAGVPPFALAAPTGGRGYWHPHRGDDPLRMVLDEFLPLLGSRGLRIARPAVLGYSMGGFGIGSSDSFTPAVKALRDRLPDPAVVTISKGCHDSTYWSSIAPPISA